METRVIDSSNARSWANWFLGLGLEPKEVVNRLSKGGWQFEIAADKAAGKEVLYKVANPKQLVYMLYNPEGGKPAVF